MVKLTDHWPWERRKVTTMTMKDVREGGGLWWRKKVVAAQRQGKLMEGEKMGFDPINLIFIFYFFSTTVNVGPLKLTGGVPPR